MILDELEKTKRLPGFDRVCSFEAGVPVYSVTLKVLAEKKQSVPKAGGGLYAPCCPEKIGRKAPADPAFSCPAD